MDLHPFITGWGQPWSLELTATTTLVTLLSTEIGGLKTSVVSHSLQLLQLCRESLGTSALFPNCFASLPLNVKWEYASSGAQLHYCQAHSQVRAGETGGLLPHFSTSIVLCWQGNGTTLVQTSFLIEVSVWNAWKNSHVLNRLQEDGCKLRITEWMKSDGAFAGYQSPFSTRSIQSHFPRTVLRQLFNKSEGDDSITSHGDLCQSSVTLMIK